MNASTFWSEWGQPVIDILTSTPGVAAFLVGFVVGFLGTQWAKSALPHEWPAEKRRLWVLFIAFFLYAVPCWLLWPVGWDWAALSGIDRYLVVVLGLLAGIALGFGSMFFYGLVMRYLYAKGWASEEKWSAEAKAEKKRLQFKKMDDGELGLKVDDDKTRALTAEERKDLGLPDNTVPKEK